jgi:diguanylate cyclase (GGDEF)-like protein
MSRIVDHLTDLTGYRDRDVLDTTLVTVLRDLVQPRSIAICHAVGQAPAQRWVIRARLSHDDIAARTDPESADVESAPPVADFPDRLACLTEQEPVEVPGDGRYMTYFPLLNDRDIVGVLEVESQAELDANQLRMVGSMLRVYRNMQSLLDYSERDSLTGLLNRKTFDDTFSSLALQSGSVGAPAAERRDGAPERHVYLGMIDVDHFKAVNDRHGHLIGDEVLLLLSRLMRASFRYGDRLYRFGGEEFVVLLRCASDKEAALAFERLRAEAEAYPFPLVGRVTVSIGFTRVRPDDNQNAAYERADKAVYWVKAHGRNQVGDHAKLLALGEIKEQQRGGDIDLF